MIPQPVLCVFPFTLSLAGLAPEQIAPSAPGDLHTISVALKLQTGGELTGAVLGREAILELSSIVPRIPVAPHVVAHAVALARATRPDEPSAPEEVKRYVRFGAGPRASQALVLGAKARAALDGRLMAEVEDVNALLGPVFRHRLVPSFRAEAEGVRIGDIIAAVARAARP